MRGTTYTYDAKNRLDVLSHGSGVSYDFDYDNGNRITRIADVDGVTNYTYDKNNQLTVADHSNSNKPDEGFSYDANGNRNSSGYQTGSNNRLNSDGKYNYVYDDEGNLIRRTEISSNKVTEYEWDYRNRLAGVFDRNAGGNVTQEVGFKYDSQNRRISKKVGSNETRFVYDRDNVLLDFAVSGANQPVLDKRYLFGAGVDQILAQESAQGTVLWGLTDQLGTVKDWVNSSGSVANHVVYDSFGGVVSQSYAALGSRYGFTGRELDAETGLYYYRSRYYNPGIGRFIGEDSVGFGGGDANLYRYVGNSPLDNTDPYGMNSAELQALLSNSRPRNGNTAKDTIWYYNTTFPGYSAALVNATNWFYLITDRNSRAAGDFAEGAWHFRGNLKNAPGKGILRPFGLNSPKREPTIELQKDKATGQYHGTVVGGVTTKATEVKFLFDEEANNSQRLLCPVPRPYREPILQNGRPVYPSPAPSPSPTPSPAPTPWQIPRIIPELIQKGGEGASQWLQRRQN